MMKPVPVAPIVLEPLPLLFRWIACGAGSKYVTPSGVIGSTAWSVLLVLLLVLLIGHRQDLTSRRVDEDLGTVAQLQLIAEGADGTLELDRVHTDPGLSAEGGLLRRDEVDVGTEHGFCCRRVGSRRCWLRGRCSLLRQGLRGGGAQRGRGHECG